MRKLAHLPTTWLLATLVAFISLLSACSQEGKVGEASSLYGTTSRKWVLDKETAAGGDNVEQADDNQTFTFFQNGQYTMASSAETMNGKYAYNVAGKTITLTPDGGTPTEFMIKTLTDDHLTMAVQGGAEIKLKSE